jgi:hypothetical protein
MEPRWKRVARAIYTVLFFLVWAESITCFLYFMRVFRRGSPWPTAARPDGLSNHGQVMYISHSQKVTTDLLLTAMLVGIPSMMVLGLVLHHVVGVRLFRNMPTRDG